MMSIREALSALRARWWLPMLFAIAAGGAATGFSLLQTPQYSSSMELFVSATGAGQETALQGSQFSEERVTSYARLLRGEQLAGRVIDRLDLDETPERLAKRISANAIPETVFIDVTVTDPSPERARDIARVLADEFIDLANRLETPRGGASPVVVTVTEEPDANGDPVSPRTAFVTAAAIVVGFLAGIGLALLLARLDRSVKDPEVASELAGAPVLGTVLRDARLAKEHVVDRADVSRVAEDYRQLRTNLNFVRVDDPPRVIMITSALPSEGKTTAAVNLGLALADAGQRVTLLEADLRRPKLTEYLGLVSGTGLTNLLAGTVTLGDVLQEVGDRGVAVLAAGSPAPNPGELVGSQHMADLLEDLRKRNDFVIVDAPPLLPVADASGLAPFVDGILLSVRHGATTIEQLRQAVSVLDRVRGRLLGVVMNIVPPAADAGRSYGYSGTYDAPQH